MEGRKELGKISAVSFGRNSDRPFLFGLELTFSGKGWGTFTMLNANMSDTCKWSEDERNAAFFEICKRINKLLEDANVDSVDELVGIPVEVTFENKTLSDFRILTEVL